MVELFCGVVIVAPCLLGRPRFGGVREELTKCVEAVLAEVMNQRGDVGNRFGDPSRETEGRRPRVARFIEVGKRSKM